MVNGFPYIVDGTGGAGLGPFSTAPIPGTVAADNSDYGALLVDANSSQLTFKFISTAGSVIDSYTMTDPAPAIPSNFAGRAVSGNQINLTWTANSTNASGYYIYRSTDGITFNQIATVGPYTTNYLDQGLAPGDYYYKVMAFNSGGFSPISSASHTTLPVPPPRMSDQPTNLTAIPVSNNQVVLSWQDNSGGQDTFNIFRSSDGSTFNQVATAGRRAITLIDTPPTSTTYFYQITATNSNGNTPPTPVVSATLAPFMTRREMLRCPASCTSSRPRRSDGGCSRRGRTRTSRPPHTT